MKMEGLYVVNSAAGAFLNLVVGDWRNLKIWKLQQNSLLKSPRETRAFWFSSKSNSNRNPVKVDGIFF